MIYFLFIMALLALLVGAVANVSMNQNKMPAWCFLSVLIVSFCCLMMDLPDWVADRGTKTNVEKARFGSKTLEGDFFAELMEDDGKPAKREEPEPVEEPRPIGEPEIEAPVPKYSRNVHLAKFRSGELVCIDQELYLATDLNSLKKLFEKDGSPVLCSEIND